MIEITPKSKINAVVSINGSKSVTHRALITSALAEGQSVLEEFLSCEDTLYTLEALRKMGVDISIDENKVIVNGTGGDFPSNDGMREIFLGNAGTSYRLLLSIAALAKGEYVLTGIPRMLERPIGDLVAALKTLGVKAECVGKEGYPPVSVKAEGIKGGSVKIQGNISSQYLSSLLLAAPYAQNDVEIEVIGELVSRPYIDVTLDVMQAFGINIENNNYGEFKIASQNKYRSRRFIVDGDVSSASYFWGAAAITGGTAVTNNIHPFTTRQGDIALLDIMEKMGCHVIKEDNSVTVKGGTLKGVDVDMGALPDMVPTMAAVALFAEGQTTIRNVAHLRYKESDRIGDTVTEWQKLGGHIEETEDGLIIQGGYDLKGAEMDPHDDHRLAMSLAMVGLKVPGVRIRNENCVDKSFPSFWKFWDLL
ncbi:3-phosphoshikimate 1-carboxyvinyltransferase [Thermodesulfobacteriota bacterium]